MNTGIIASIVIITLATPTSGALDQSEPEVLEPHRPIMGCLVNDQLTGHWGGVRDSLEESGISISAENVFEYSGVIEGGVNQTDSTRNLFTADLEIDTESLFGLKGGTMFAQFLSVTAEKGGSRDAGDLQGYTNIENDQSLDTLYELWYQQVLFNGRFRAKIGKVDANSEFAYVAPLKEVSAACEFTHSSAGFHPTIAGFPSYPDPAMSVNLFITPYDGDQTQLTLAYGFYDGSTGVDGVTTGSRGPSTFFSDKQSGDYFHIAEGQFAWEGGGGLSGGSLSIGGWFHTGDWDTFQGGVEDGTMGWYATIQQQLTAPDEKNTGHGLYIFGQYGYGDDHVVEVGQVFSAGLLQNGLGSFRPDDLLGVYASYADLSDDLLAGFDGNELAVETLYRFYITSAMAIQPGLQYIFNPSGDPSVDDAFVGQLRFIVAL